MMMKLTMEMMTKMTTWVMILRKNLVVLSFAADRMVVVLPKLEDDDDAKA